jgi:acetate kinase
MESPAVAAFLKDRVVALRGLSPDRLRTLAEGSQVRSFRAGDIILHQGDEPLHFGVVLSGDLDVSARGEEGRRQSFGRVTAGETFNDIALMTGQSIAVDFIAGSACEVLLIPVSLFRAMVVSEPAAVQHLSRKIAERMQSVFADPLKAAAVRQGGDSDGLQLKGERQEKVLVINCGSSSLKYSFFDTADESRNAHGQIERIGIEGTRLTHRASTADVTRPLATAGFAEAFQAMLSALTSESSGVVRSLSDISLVAHRVVHGGEQFTAATLITDEVVAQIERLSPLAPLHNPVNLDGIRQMRRLLSAIPQVAVFDTAFHHTMPPEAYLYGLPYEKYEKDRIRRYGFHGTSHQSVSLRAARFLNRQPNSLRLVSCHLGNGSSLCAVDHGRSVDTTMGFTPSEGLIMGTRCGDLDSGVIAFLERTEGMSTAAIEHMLNKESGLLGLSGVSSDMREILKAAEAGQPRALVALKAYCYRVRKSIGGLIAAMGGADVIVFTAGIGQGSAEVRSLAVQGLECMGVVLDVERNRNARGFDEVCRISSDDSQVAVLVVPTDEERMMARQALRAVERSRVTRALECEKRQPILVEVSAHHVHLTQEHVEALFGPGHQLTRHSDLSQPGQFACKEQLTIVGPKGRIERVRVLGPPRNYTQIEIAMTEQYRLGVHPPIRESGDIADSPGCVLEGPNGRLQLDRGVICALRHIHMTPEDALRYGVRDKSVVRVRIDGDRELVFGDVLVRVHPQFSLAMHIDTDEANAANVRTGAQAVIESIQNEG